MVAIKVKEPYCQNPARPNKETVMHMNYFEVATYALELERQVTCYKTYFKEVNK